MSDKVFHHVTEAERLEAITLWNQFHAQLRSRGLKLFYNYDAGEFYVADLHLREGFFKKDGTPGTSYGLTQDELEVVTHEGGFGDNAECNPPWFTTFGHGGYTLEVPLKVED